MPYRDTDNVELIGMGYFHPIFPLIPIADWEEQLRTGRELMQEVFGRAPRGFWPPEMAFSMEMIPALVKAGYEYVVVDGVHVHPQDGVNDVFRPYLACYEGSCMTVVPPVRAQSPANTRAASRREPSAAPTPLAAKSPVPEPPVPELAAAKPTESEPAATEPPKSKTVAATNASTVAKHSIAAKTSKQRIAKKAAATSANESNPKTPRS